SSKVDDFRLVLLTNCAENTII
ncbi:unnamed protein product, partial [Rotaria magnacalcarata]